MISLKIQLPPDTLKSSLPLLSVKKNPKYIIYVGKVERTNKKFYNLAQKTFDKIAYLVNLPNSKLPTLTYGDYNG